MASDPLALELQLAVNKSANKHLLLQRRVHRNLTMVYFTIDTHEIIAALPIGQGFRDSPTLPDLSLSTQGTDAPTMSVTVTGDSTLANQEHSQVSSKGSASRKVTLDLSTQHLGFLPLVQGIPKTKSRSFCVSLLLECSVSPAKRLLAPQHAQKCTLTAAETHWQTNRPTQIRPSAIRSPSPLLGASRGQTPGKQCSGFVGSEGMSVLKMVTCVTVLWIVTFRTEITAVVTHEESGNISR
ncbi:hypothetical protein STEG23_022562 [Scotinomys teguina]